MGCPPQNVTFNLDTGMTGEEQLGAGGDFFVEFDVFQWISKTCYEPTLSVRNCHHLARSTSSSYLFVSKFRVDKICTVNDPPCIRRQ